MIFTRTLVSAVVVTLLVPVLGPGGPDPGLALAGRAVVAERAREADAALAELDDALADVLAPAREGAALVAGGDEPPGPRLVEAADALDERLDVAARADSALRRLAGARLAVDPEAEPLDATADPDDLATASAELRALAASADGFADLRRRAEGMTTLLADALDAIEDGDIEAARMHLATARTDHDAIAAWEPGLLSLPVWIETTGDLLEAVEELLAAVESNDGPAAEAAAARVAALDDDAVTADRALRIAMSEGAAFVAEGPLATLAEAERELAVTRAQVASILQSVGR